MLNDLSAQVLAINKSNGWDVAVSEDWEDNPNKTAAKLCLIHSEVSEALEEVRRGDLQAFALELADVIIRVLDLSAGLKVDIDRAVAVKMTKNKKRGFRHGGKRI